jgi:carbonic anhydrase
VQKIRDGIRRFQQEVHPAHRSLFESLAGGQQPEVLWITCSDSRVDPALVTQTRPGDLFVLRNAGNLIPPYGSGSGTEAATVEYAIRGLGVRHIVVCGHSRCGAMAAVLDPDSAAAMPAVQACLNVAGPPRLTGPEATLENQIRRNVTQQIGHLGTHPAVSDAMGRGELELHGWVYDFVAGQLEVLSGGEGKLVSPTNAARA